MKVLSIVTALAFVPSLMAQSYMAVPLTNWNPIVSQFDLGQTNYFATNSFSVPANAIAWVVGWHGDQPTIHFISPVTGTNFFRIPTPSPVGTPAAPVPGPATIFVQVNSVTNAANSLVVFRVDRARIARPGGRVP